MRKFIAKHNILRTIIAILIAVFLWIVIFGVTFFVSHLGHRVQGQYNYDIDFLGITLFNVNNGTFRLNFGSYLLLALLIIVCVLIMHFLGKHWSKKYDLNDYDNKHRAKKEGAKAAKKEFEQHHKHKNSQSENSGDLESNTSSDSEGLKTPSEQDTTSESTKAND